VERSARPDVNEALTTLANTIGATLKRALEQRLANLSVQEMKSTNNGNNFSSTSLSF